MPKSREEFDSLLEKYLKRQCTVDEQKMMDQWYEAIGTGAIDFEVNDEVEMKLWKAIEKKTHLDSEPVIKQLVQAKRKVSYSALIGVAASISIIILAGIYFLIPTSSSKGLIALVHPIEKESGIVIIKNTDSKVVRPVQLEDGSLVILQPNSEIQYARSFANDHREVTLKGEAFFEITRDVNHPFLVHAEGLVTKVLGTSFNIKAKPADNTIVVDVKTGKVAVFRENNTVHKKQYFLTPNQQVVYDRDADVVLHQLQENPQIIISEKEINEMKFDEAPATEVFDALIKAYGVDLIYDKTVFSNCSLTTHLSNEGLYEKLQIICKALGATYETKETKVLIQGKGCESEQ